MNCEEAKISLHDFIDEELDGFMKRDVEAHLRKCDSCFNEYKQIRIFFDKLKDLPYFVEPPEELVKTFSGQLLTRSLKEEAPDEAVVPGDLKKLRKEQTRLEKQFQNSRGALRKSFISKTIIVPEKTSSYSFTQFSWTKVLLILLPVVLLAVGYFIYDYQKNNSPWRVTTLEGRIAVNGFNNFSGKISQGQSLLSESSSKASIRVPKVGTVEVGENSLIILEKAKDGSNRISLKQGAINVANMTSMPDFSIKLKNYTIVDRGGEFSISIDDQQNIKIYVKYGFTEIINGEKTIYLNEGYMCEARYGFKIGTPYRISAPEELKNEVINFDFNNGGGESLDKIMELADEKDAMTLLALIPNSSRMKRQLLFQSIANKFPPPEGVTRMGIIDADSEMLYLWWQEIEWQL